jgi:glycosyltransferase involved in cell wall biosynthesis
VGRLEARKGVQVLCEAIPEVIKSAPMTKFVLVGQDTNTATDGGSIKRHITEEAQGRGFMDSIVLIDFLSEDELIQLYSACDVFVLPSLYETFGLVTMEAMACGKPVVATATGVIPELGLDGESGIMVPLGDAGALAEAMIKLLLLKNEEKRLIARKNRELIEARFSIPAWVDKMVDVYEKALGR